MSFKRDRETLLRRCKELYWQHRERETPEEREVRLARRREYYTHWRTALSTEQQESILQQRREAYSTYVEVDELAQSSGKSADQGSIDSAEIPPRCHYKDNRISYTYTIQSALGTESNKSNQIKSE